MSSSKVVEVLEAFGNPDILNPEALKVDTGSHISAASIGQAWPLQQLQLLQCTAMMPTDAAMVCRFIAER